MSKRAFIVDDSETDRLVMRSLLDHAPAIDVVGEGDTVACALEQIHRLRPDLLLLDIQMRGETGFDLVAGLRYRPPIVFVTGQDARCVTAHGFKPTDCVPKPVILDNLMRTIERVCRESEAGRGG